MIALVWVTSCQRPDSEVLLPKAVTTPFAVSQKQAKELAQHFVTTMQEKNKNPSARVDAIVDITDEKTVYDDATNEPLLHIINRKNGFIVISADFRTMPVLAYSDESSFDTEKMPEGVKMWLEAAKLKIKDVRKPDMVADSVVIKEWQKHLAGNLSLPTSKSGRIASCYEWYQYGQFMCQNRSSTWGPFLNTTWGQAGISSTSLLASSCSCNRSLAGCGPVAMAQIWEYYRSDPSRPRTSNYSCTANSSGEVSLGQLMLSTGIASSANYNYLGTCNTFTWPNNISSGLSNMGFSSGGTQTVGYNALAITQELTGGHPLIFWGSTCLACFSDYHIWVADGLEEHEYNTFNCETLQCDTWAYTYLHMNWGWDGSYNGWYGFGTYNPGGQNYNANLHVIKGIRS